MIGKLASDLFDRVAQCAEKPTTKDIGQLRKILKDMENQLDEISEEEFQFYARDFLLRWLPAGTIENDFVVFASETNEIMVEFGNEGYFDELDTDEF